MSIVREWERLQTVEVALKSLSSRVHLIWLIALVAACGTSDLLGGPNSTTGSSQSSTEDASETTIPSPAESTAPSTSLSGAVSTAAGSVMAPVDPQSFVETWNRVALIQGRGEWMIDPSLSLSPSSSPEGTSGLQVSLGGDPPQLVVDAIAGGDRMSRLEIAVLRWDESSVELVEDAFQIGVMTALATDDPSQLDGFVRELMAQAIRSPTDQTDTVELPGGLVAGSFSTDQVYVLGVSWPSE